MTSPPVPFSGPVLVTGGTGFLGSHLVRALVARGLEVHVPHRPGSDRRRLTDVAGRVTFWPLDLTDADGVEATCRAAQPETVVHLAGNTGLRFIKPDLAGVRESVEQSVLGSLNLVLALHRTGAPRIVVRAGGVEEYGRGPAPFAETQREAPVSPYSASQVAVTHYLQMLQPALAFPVVTLRPALVYGPAQSEEFLIPSLIRHCLEGRDFSMTSGEQVRDLVYVADVVDAVLLAAVRLDLGGRVINVGSGRRHKVAEVARAVVRLSGAAIALRVDPARARASEIQDHCFDTGLAERLLGWRSTTDLEAGLTATIAWYRERLRPETA